MTRPRNESGGGGTAMEILRHSFMQQDDDHLHSRILNQMRMEDGTNELMQLQHEQLLKGLNK